MPWYREAAPEFGPPPQFRLYRELGDGTIVFPPPTMETTHLQLRRRKMFWGRSEPDSISTINDDDDDDESSRFLFPEMSTAILRDTPMPTMNIF